MPAFMEATRVRAEGKNKPNAGLQARLAHVIGSRKFDMVGCIHADIFQEHYMLNEVEIKVRPVRSKDAFSLMGDTPNDAKLEITHIFCTKGEHIAIGVRRPCPGATEQTPNTQ